MKKVLLLLGIAMAISCNSNGEGNKSQEATENVAKKVLPTASVKHITKAEYLQLVYNYEKNPKTFVYEGKIPAIVDFYADWCGPCKRVAPILDKLAAKYAGKINIYKVDVDAEKDLAGAHGIQSIPTMILFPIGGQPQVVQGALPEDQLEAAIQQVLLAPQKTN